MKKIICCGAVLLIGCLTFLFGICCVLYAADSMLLPEADGMVVGQSDNSDGVANPESESEAELMEANSFVDSFSIDPEKTGEEYEVEQGAVSF